MNGQRTHSILERAPAILAVTAASYGLTGPHRAQAGKSDKDDAARRNASTSAPSRTGRETAPSAH